MNVDEARALMKGLQDQGFQIRTPGAKFSACQAKIKSTIAAFKRCFKSSQLPGTVPLNNKTAHILAVSEKVTTFSRTAKMCAALLNTLPIVLLPPTLADPEELMTLSPSAIRGPADSEWFSLGQSLDYRGQHALQAQALNRLKKVLANMVCPKAQNSRTTDRCLQPPTVGRHCGHHRFNEQLHKKQSTPCSRKNQWFHGS